MPPGTPALQGGEYVSNILVWIEELAFPPHSVDTY